MLHKITFKNALESMTRFINNFPRKHFFALIILFVIMLIIAFIPKKPNSHNSFKRKLIKVNQFKSYDSNTQNANENIYPPKSRNRTINIKVKKGDNISRIFQREGLSTGQLQELLDVDISYLQLDHIHPGQRITLIISPKQKLISLVLALDEDSSIHYLWKDNAYIAVEKTKKSIWKKRSYTGEIRDTFSISAIQAGLTASQAYQISNALGQKINFRRDIHPGNTFRILASKQYIDGKFTGNSEVNAIILKTRRNTYTAFLNSDGRYYNKKGVGLGKAYRRKPVSNRFRISSSFNPRRLNPVTKRISPHNGTDFAVPIGTKVRATGDGVVLKSQKHHYAAGNYVVIQNSRHYSTRFLHLSKSFVKRGQRVKMGEVIALSGNTGRSTGPHLHFEFRIDNKPVDAMKVDLPLSSRVSAKNMLAFKRLRNLYLKEMGV
ncbi:MAG: peptidoglycan DD-metalloendopeptidase family protein [Psychromonas sp.]|nr:peptidoglycan DD-metalloendopeptidase family protein [Psychromonas sp.]